MNENTVQIAVALILVNLVAWGGFVVLEDEPEIIYKYREPLSNSANVTVSFDFGELSNESVTFFTSVFNNTNITSISYDNVIVTNDTSAYAATILASQIGGFSVDVTWYSFGPYIHTIDSVSNDSHYWGLYHNGEYSMIGASDLQLQDGDVILWKLDVANW
tara:strand:+ start:310 stop:792 length:483 start_codon:yes stop_codon:yes gene_type:complete